MPMAKLDDVLRNENAIVVMTASAAVFTNKSSWTLSTSRQCWPLQFCRTTSCETARLRSLNAPFAAPGLTIFLK
jgi:hypothetical protein